MKAPQERKTPKVIRHRDLGHPPIEMKATDDALIVGEIIERGRGAAAFRSREEVELLRDFAQAWLDHDADDEA